MTKFSYDISVRDLIPPMAGGYRYFAKVPHLYRNLGTREVEEHVDFGETYGATEEEAERSMREKVERWIKEQN